MSRVNQEVYSRRDQHGASLVEAMIVFPIFIFTVLAIMQAALVFYAKSNVNYAAFEAARAGSTHNASVSSIKLAFEKAMIPYYGGGTTEAQLAKTFTDVVTTDLSGAALRVEILSPTQESFTDYNSPKLQTAYKTSEPVIPNVGLDELSCPRDQSGCKSEPKTNASGQTLLDANLLKLRITYGIPQLKQMPLAGRLYTWALGQLGAGKADAFKQALIDDGRIPIVTSAVLRMQSDAVRNTAMVSSPGPGNDGKPTDPGPTPSGDPLPTCGYADPSCTTPPSSSGGAGGSSNCSTGVTLVETASSDVLFDFDKSTLNDAGKKTLDALIEQSKTRSFDSLTLTGYTDPLGSDAYNATLSLDRANAVRDYLKGHGFPDKPISTEGKGSQDLIKNLSDCPIGATQIACLAPDRRVVFTFENVK